MGLRGMYLVLIGGIFFSGKNKPAIPVLYVHPAKAAATIRKHINPAAHLNRYAEKRLVRGSVLRVPRTSSTAFDTIRSDMVCFSPA